MDFRSDGGNFMSYANDACNMYFTPEQAGAMRANLIDQKPGHLYNQDPENTPISVTPAELEPIGFAVGGIQAVDFKWTSVPNATTYYFEANRLPNFNPTFKVAEMITSDTAINIPDVWQEGFTYYWRVRAYNPGYTCTSNSAGVSFEPVGFINTNNIDELKNVQIIPNFLSTGNMVQIQFETERNLPVNIDLFNLAGQQLKNIYQGQTNGFQSIEIETNGLEAGMYFITIEVEGSIMYRKIVIY